MNHSLKFLSCLFIATVFATPHLLFAQQTSPITDTSKADSAKKKPVFTLQTLRIQPMYVFEINDNAKINADSQFPGYHFLADSFHYAGERHLQDLWQLTFEGTNTHPSLSSDGHFIVFQARGITPNSCDQIYRMPLPAARPAERISSGKGLATSPVFLSDNRIVYASTETLNGGACPPESTPAHGDLYVSDTNGKETGQLTHDGSALSGDIVVNPAASQILFASTRSGNPHLVAMKPDGTDVHKLTSATDYDGGAAYSPDGTTIVFCKRHGGNRDLYLMDASGHHERELTHGSGQCLSPCWSPDGQHIIFASNKSNSRGNDYDLYMIKSDGTDLERITDGGGYNGFPTFTHDGKYLIFCSSRNATHPGDINIFAAKWVP